MVNYLKDFILNIFFIFSPFVFYPYIHRFEKKPIIYRALLFALFSIVLIIIMNLPININGIIYDFRSIPVIVGSLYGGPVVSILLFSVLIIYRLILGNPNNLIYIASILPSLLLVLLTFRMYHPLKTYQKVVLAIILCTMMKLVTITSYLLYIKEIDLFVNSFQKSIETYLAQAVIVAACIYLLDNINKYFHMQDEVVKSEKVKIVSDMAASVAHEIRNPLTTVRGFIQLLGEENIDKEKKAYFQRICLEELNRADQIITDYLSLAKPDPETVEHINIIDELSYLSNILLTYANYNNIRIKTSYMENKNIFIIGDKQKFRQALINIGKNGIEAMHNGGSLEMNVTQTETQVIMRVIDTGIGMTPNQIKRLGTPYYSTKDKGTGLGTMVSYAIIKKMQGKIQVKSEVGKGTEYIFTFPKVHVNV